MTGGHSDSLFVPLPARCANIATIWFFFKCLSAIRVISTVRSMAQSVVAVPVKSVILEAVLLFVGFITARNGTFERFGGRCNPCTTAR